MALTVWVVVRPNEVDGVYVFESEEPARTYAGRFDSATVSNEVVIADADAASFFASEMEGG